jgi:hypothetical protein
MELDGRSSKKSLHNYSREDDEKLKSFSLFATQNKAQKMLENKLDKKKRSKGEANAVGSRRHSANESETERKTF